MSGIYKRWSGDPLHQRTNFTIGNLDGIATELGNTSGMKSLALRRLTMDLVISPHEKGKAPCILHISVSIEMTAN